ncbi:TetR/AcrR family transcriptional regulator [Nocardioides alcanivorans]|uniref:TetR/AcrR family transcriptional regulator n=1 Tax=Nocardioides alcanivorans TaxID=2897352 RepID=UPI001F31BB63|nr:TetR/AcrR family transcriptional regulator [Nocardioides alcanivorans]
MTDSRPADGDVWSGRRADARRNHDRVLAAATEVFTERGLEATIPEVAALAGVGKATVYRSYPTKAHLVDALAQVHVVWLSDALDEAMQAAETDAHAALGTYLHAVAGRLAENKLMSDVMAQATHGVDSEAATEKLDRILGHGRAQGTIRNDITPLDIRVLVSGFVRALLGLDIRDPALWHRYARLTMAALRP